MKELSKQSLAEIRHLIQGQNYANIYARLQQFLPMEAWSLFARVQLIGNSAIWYGEDGVDYHMYSNATAEEKEEIAYCLEKQKEEISHLLEGKMEFVNELFRIPSRDQIFWWRNGDGNISVVLTQWGFCNKAVGDDVDIIDIMVNEPRVLSQTDVTVHVDYSDGLPAGDIDYRLLLFNGSKIKHTDEEGNSHIGQLFHGKPFAVEDPQTGQHVDFLVDRERTVYSTVFDCYTSYRVEVKNQFGESKPEYTISIDGKPVVTDKDGVYMSDKVLLMPEMSVAVKYEEVETAHSLARDPKENVFVIQVTDQVAPPDNPDNPVIPPVIPEPEPPVAKGQDVSIRLYDYDGTPLPNLPFVLRTSKGERIEGITDSKGCASFPMDRFKNKTRYRIHFTVSREYREQNKEQQHEQESR